MTEETKETVETVDNPETSAEETKETNNTANSEIEKLKKLLSKANTEAAGYKKQLREHMSAEEKAKAEADDYLNQLKSENESLKKSQNILNYTNEYMKLGMSAELAKATAEAKADGDDTTVFMNLKQMTEEIAKSALAKAMDSQKGISKGNPVNAEKKTYTREEIKKMTPDEINKNWDAIQESLKKGK